MRVLVACEFSGTVRDAFLRHGHDAVSCDLLPTEAPGPHIQDDVLDHLQDGWDLLIAHPPCTHLAVSGARWFRQKGTAMQDNAIWFFRQLAECPAVPRICVENPIGIISTRWRKPDQIIQPYQFGHPESKKTCLWLKNLPPLWSTRMLALPRCGYWANQTPSGQNKLGPSPNRARIRATTYRGIAEAMARQWGTLSKGADR